MAGGQVVLMKSGADDANGITIFVVHAQSRFGMALMPIGGAVWQPIDSAQCTRSSMVVSLQHLWHASCFLDKSTSRH